MFLPTKYLFIKTAVCTDFRNQKVELGNAEHHKSDISR
jgi:hypothetical protein